MFGKRLKSHSALTALFIALALPFLLTACVQHYSSVGTTETYHPRVPDTRPVTVSGEVLEFPAGAAIPTLLASPAVRENDLGMLEAAPGARKLMAPRMKVSNGTTGSFKLDIENRPAQVSLELTPRIQTGDEVALGTRIATRGPGGVGDSLSRDVIYQANSGSYGVYGPLKLDDRTVYALLRVDLE